MGERMNQQRDFAAPFTGCEQLNKSLQGNPPPSSLSTWGLWVERRTSKGSIEAARVLGALVRAAKGNVMSTSFGGSRIAREQSEAEKGLREKCGARSGPLVLKEWSPPQIEEKFLVKTKPSFFTTSLWQIHIRRSNIDPIKMIYYHINIFIV